MTARPENAAAGPRLFVLTGAGISAESGIPTFRGVNGLWNGWRIEEVASPRAFERDPLLVWKFYSERRAGAKDKEPHAGHRALAELEPALGERMFLCTQNVDHLHERAGSKA
ncbi:MAG TPA: Sir2 family NAD-dependent protein deacetylase, partial [Candidatus Eisenbacteria bacterium]|nr:Sir2 family NAD-dependent protein deacetylase [Candidatus Eisenbacteria bacterium]